MIMIETAAPSLETGGINPVNQVQQDAVMQVDEEGRPRFAPAQKTVRSTPCARDESVLIRCAERNSHSREPKSTYPTTPNDASQGRLAEDVSATRRAPSPTGAHEPQGQGS